MRASLAIAGLCLLFAVPAGCTHDLDKLREGRGPNNLRAGTSGRLSAAGRDGTAGSDGGGGGDGGGGDAGSSGALSPSACEPCPMLAPAASALSLRSCCRGVTNNECGLTFAQGSLCLARMAPGQPDPACEDTRAAGMDLAGCCRPDGRCGVVASQFGLGCVALDDIPPAIGGSDQPVPCQFECTVDSDCSGISGGFVCAENRTHTERLCADDCRRDEDCAGINGAVCALSVDLAMNRVLAICQPPLGDVLPGGFCTAPNDCVHGACVQLTGGDPYCSQLCRNNGDCPSAYPDCYPEQIPSPNGGRVDEFTICGNL